MKRILKLNLLNCDHKLSRGGRGGGAEVISKYRSSKNKKRTKTHAKDTNKETLKEIVVLGSVEKLFVSLPQKGSIAV